MEAIITKVSINIDGMDCSDCELVLEHRLSRLEGVFEVDANLGDQMVQVKYDPRRIRKAAIEKRIRQMGYDPIPSPFMRWLLANRELIFCLASGLLLFLGWLGGKEGWFSEQSATLLIIAAYFPAGYDVGRAAVHSLRKRELDTDTLMFAAALGAAALGKLAEGALLIFLFALGQALQNRALDRARNAVRGLANIAPRWAVVQQDGQDELVRVEKLTLDDIVIVRPGERIPVDGEVLKGHSSVNQAPLTGESIPVEKTPGEDVLAGSLNLDGTLEVRVRRLAKDSTLQRVMKVVEQAQAAQSPTQLWVDRFTRVFVPVVMVVFFLLLLVPVWNGEPFEQAFVRAVSFLVAASPCALALGTPSAMLSGIAQAARHGVLVKGGVHLENLGRIRAIAFDKTGTLTLGEPRVTDVIAMPGTTRDQLLAMAAAIESRSNHPFAQAVSARAKELGLIDLPAEMVENLAGRGLRAQINGQPVWVGGLKLLEELELDVPEGLRRPILELEGQGKSVMLVGTKDKTLGLIALADAIRPESKDVLKELASLGLKRAVMLSGDNQRAAGHIAEQAGLVDFRAGLLPEDKLAIIRNLVDSYQFVGMVGDGVNDAPALAQATVGIALGSAKNDLALEAADVALMSPDLLKLPFSISLGRAVHRITLQNLIISMASILFLTFLSLSGTIEMGMTVFFHEGATLLVVANALRLFAFKS